ncbi:hypothetical protein AB4212_24530, partial [Streptomyces sp. 2MCAF27]
MPSRGCAGTGDSFGAFLSHLSSPLGAAAERTPPPGPGPSAEQAAQKRDLLGLLVHAAALMAVEGPH